MGKACDFYQKPSFETQLMIEDLSSKNLFLNHMFPLGFSFVLLFIGRKKIKTGPIYRRTKEKPRGNK